MGLKVRILKEQNSIIEERTRQAEHYRSSKQLSKEEQHAKIQIKYLKKIVRILGVT